MALSLGIAFCLTRVAFRLGYRRAPPLRAIGVAGGFYATVAAVALAIASLVP